MTTILLNGRSFDVILSATINTTTINSDETTINNDVKLSDDVWSKGLEELEFEIKLTNAEKWFIDQIILASSLVEFSDNISQISENVWLNNVAYRMSNEFSKPWILTFNLYIVKEMYIVPIFIGFEDRGDGNKFAIGFERIAIT